MTSTPKERPIIFSAPLVRAILDGRKTQTRRVVKGILDGTKMVKYYGAYTDGKYPNSAPRKALENSLGWFVQEAGDLRPCNVQDRIKCPYGKVGDRLWVRETWNITFKDQLAPGEVIAKTPNNCFSDNGGFACACGDGVVYAADGIKEHPQYGKALWKPSIHMPRSASRILLEITNVRVEQLNECSFADAQAEGWSSRELNGDPSRLDPLSWYTQIWESLNGPGSWDLNPFVWVLEFRRINNGTN